MGMTVLISGIIGLIDAKFNYLTKFLDKNFY